MTDQPTTLMPDKYNIKPNKNQATVVISNRTKKRYHDINFFFSNYKNEINCIVLFESMGECEPRDKQLKMMEPLA